MKTALTILAGLLVGVLVGVGVLAAFVFVGPDPVGLQPTPAPTLVPPSISPSPSLVPSPSTSPSASPARSPSPAAGSPGVPASGGSSTPAGSPLGRVDAGAAFHGGQPPPALPIHLVVDKDGIVRVVALGRGPAAGV
jgi:hypothetical protein